VHKLSFITRCIATAALLSFGPATIALASPTMNITVGPDPAESITTQLGVTGTSESSDTLVVLTVKPAGGQGCGANNEADGGSGVISTGVTNGVFNQAVNRTFESAGSYLLCGWMRDETQNNAPLVASTSLTFAVRQPHLSLSIAAPQSVTTGQTLQVSTTAQAETTRSVYESALPSTGRGCPANWAAVGWSGTSTVLDEWSVAGGPATEVTNLTLSASGSYLLCGYFQKGSSDTAPEATATATVSVISPSPPCVVPNVVPGVSLVSVEQEIRADGCSIGSIRSTASRTVFTGRVMRLSPAPGTRLSAGAAVSISISSGPPCVVPRIGSRESLTTIKRRLTAAHCSVGKVRYVRTTHSRRGTVIGLRPGPRTSLLSHAAVDVVLSGGRSNRHQ
jgi:hypothetical protein